MAVLMAFALTLTGSATAVSSSDVAVTIEEPEEGSSQPVNGILSGGASYEVVLENQMSSNDTTVDTKITVTGENGTTVYKWVNGTSIANGSQKTLEGEIDVSDLDVPNDADFTVDSTFTDDSDATTTTVTKTNSFKLTEGLTTAMITSLFTLLILISVIFGLSDKL